MAKMTFGTPGPNKKMFHTGKFAFFLSFQNLVSDLKFVERSPEKISFKFSHFRPEIPLERSKFHQKWPKILIFDEKILNAYFFLKMILAKFRIFRFFQAFWSEF